MYNLDDKSFEALLKTLVATHKALIANNGIDETSTIYAKQSKNFPSYEYTRIFTKVKLNPLKLLSLDNKYFSNFQRISELMECADLSFRENLKPCTDREKVDKIKLFRASIIEKAKQETKTYYQAFSTVSPNYSTGRTTSSGYGGKR